MTCCSSLAIIAASLLYTVVAVYRSHAARSGKMRGEKLAAMFYFSYAFVIGSSLLKFIPEEALCKGGVVIGLR